MKKYNPYKVVDEFEKQIAKFAGSKYAVAVESCSSAIFLSLIYKGISKSTYAWIPKHTYPSVPCSIIHSGGVVRFDDRKWKGVYEIKPYGVWDGALRFRKGMYKGGLHCLSFHMKKLLPIGRGGMILTDDKKAYKALKRLRFDGRRECPLEKDNFDMLGYNMYMTPDQAIKGIQLFSTIDQRSNKDLDNTKQGYKDLSKFKIYEN